MNDLEKLIEIHFGGQLKICSSQRIERQFYEIIYSPILDNYYWNFAFLKSNDIDLRTVWKDIKREMENLKRQPVLYVMSHVDDTKIEEQFKECNLEPIYIDVWMIREDLSSFKNYENNIDVEIQAVPSSEKRQFIQAVMDGFSSDDPNDPYGKLPEEYRIIYEKEFQVSGEYHTLEYCGKHQGKMISTANVWYKGDCAIIYSVSTHKKYQKQGICKKMMAYIMKDLARLGIKTVCVQTEQGFYTQKVYENMGFRDVMLGKAYAQKEGM